jgi:NDP-sugar pyrophosphorylase family protein
MSVDMPANAFVLAAGFGTRLRPLTLDRPKPLVPICGVPALAYSLALCARHGFREVIVNAHYLGEQLGPWQGHHEGCDVRVHVEQPDILGTGGGLKAVADQLAERFVVLNADVIHDIDLAALYASIPADGATMALRRYPTAEQPFGLVAADATHTIVQLTTLAHAQAIGEVQRDTHFTGIHAMDRSVLRYVPDGFGCIVRSMYKPLVPERRVRALPTASPWIDAGEPLALLEANLTVLRDEVHFALQPFERAASGQRNGVPFGPQTAGVTMEGPCWIGEGAQIGAGAHLSHCVIGAGAVVPAGAQLQQTVVWDGATSPRTLTRAIVHDSGVWQDA